MVAFGDDYGSQGESKEGELRSITNASSVLYMRKNTNNLYRKECPLMNVDDKYIDYKNVPFLRKYISERGKILPSRVTGISKKKQRLLRKAIIRARLLGLLPFAVTY